MKHYLTKLRAKIRASFLTACALSLCVGAKAAEFKEGVIDLQGRTIIPAKYDSIGYYPKGWFVLTDGGHRASESQKHTIVDMNGNELNADLQKRLAIELGLTIPELPSGCTLSHRQDGFLFVYSHDGSGVCSADGKEIIPTKWLQIQYVGDLLFVSKQISKNENNEWKEHQFLLDSSGNVIAELPPWAHVMNAKFHEGLLNIASLGPEPSAYIDKQGKIAIGPGPYTYAKDFSCGLAPVEYSDSHGRWSGYINHEGKLAVGPFKGAGTSQFYDGYGVVTYYLPDHKRKVGIVDTSGKFVIPADWDAIGQRDQGFLAAKNGRYFLLSHQGNVLVELAAGTYIDLTEQPNDKTLVPCDFGRKGRVTNPSKSWGYCDLSGRVVIKPKFISCGPFKGDYAVAAVQSRNSTDHVSGLIDKKGKWVVEPKYASLELVTNNRLIAAIPAPMLSTARTWEAAGSQRTKLFYQLLKTNNFIGLNRTELEAILGPGELAETKRLEPGEWRLTITYTLTPGARCGNMERSLEFGLNSDGKVFGWRETGFDSGAEPWITENVLISNPENGSALGNVVPKSDAATLLKNL